MAQSAKVAEPRIAITSVGVVDDSQGARARTIALVPRRSDDGTRTVAVVQGPAAAGVGFVFE